MAARVCQICLSCQRVLLPYPFDYTQVAGLHETEKVPPFFRHQALPLVEAEPLMRRTLEIISRSVGEDLPRRQTVARNLDLIIEALAAPPPLATKCTG